MLGAARPQPHHGISRAKWTNRLRKADPSGCTEPAADPGAAGRRAGEKRAENKNTAGGHEPGHRGPRGSDFWENVDFYAGAGAVGQDTLVTI